MVYNNYFYFVMVFDMMKSHLEEENMAKRVFVLHNVLKTYQGDRPALSPTEVFCAQKSHGYNLRGQILDLPYYGYDKAKKDARVSYRVQLVALARDSYQNHNVISHEKYYRFGTIFGRNKKEFDDICRRAAELEKKFRGSKGNEPAFLKKDGGGSLTILPRVIDLEEDNAFLQKQIKDKQDLIFARIEMFAIGAEQSGRLIEDYSKYRVYPFLMTYFGGLTHYQSGEVKAWLGDFYDLLSFEYDYRGLSKKEFIVLLESIADEIQQVIYGFDMTKKDVRRLNDFKKWLHEGSFDDPLKRFCLTFFWDWLFDLQERKIVTECECCGDLFLYSERKKYCSIRFEGKDCGKKLRNRAFYKKHQEEIRLKQRQRMVEYRDFNRERNIKEFKNRKRPVISGVNPTETENKGENSVV